jgi:hypothetical protein
MSPLAHAATATARPRNGLRVTVPLLLIWLLLLPFVIMLAPLVFAVFLVSRVNPFRGVWVYWQFFDGLRGVRVKVQDRRTLIRIF